MRTSLNRGAGADRTETGHLPGDGAETVRYSQPERRKSRYRVRAAAAMRARAAK
jgi:hypothetical protein